MFGALFSCFSLVCGVGGLCLSPVFTEYFQWSCAKRTACHHCLCDRVEALSPSYPHTACGSFSVLCNIPGGVCDLLIQPRVKKHLAYVHSGAFSLKYIT